MIRRLVVLGPLALLLAGCSGATRGSIAGGECKVFEPPAIAVRGAQQYDQDWIDGNVEAGVAGCGWQRPKVRPPTMDAVPRKPAATDPLPRKRPGVIARIKARVTGSSVEAVPYLPPAPLAIEPAPVTPPRLVDPVDELLGIK